MADAHRLGASLARALDRLSRRWGRTRSLAAALVLLAGLGLAGEAAQGEGGLDPAFGTGGIVRVTLPGREAVVRALALLPDGRILAAGDASSLEPPAAGPYLARYLPSGVPDPAFGENGLALAPRPGSIVNIRALGVQPDARAVLAGAVWGDPSQPSDFLLVRLDDRGGLDEAFGAGGWVITDFAGGSDHAASLAFEPDGDLLVAGWTLKPASQTYGLALARYRPDGSLDPSFGQGGRIATDGDGGHEQGAAVLVQPDGRIVVAGSRVLQGGGADWDFLIRRFRPNGTLDPEFGAGGAVAVDFTRPGSPNRSYDYAYAARLQPDGRILLGGVASDGTADHDFGLLRLHPDGSPDEGFGDAGRVVTDFSERVGPSYGDTLQALALQPDGRILAGGTILLRTLGGYGLFALARYQADGSLDASFALGGLVWTDFGQPSTGAFALERQGGGRILLAGGSSPTGVVAGYTADGCAPALCLKGRFLVEARWRTASSEGEGQALPLTDDTGFFWFFRPQNVEVVVKILDACSLPGAANFWVFAAGLTNQEVRLTVTDVLTGESHTWTSPLGSAYQPVLDTGRFHGSCP